MEGQKRPDYTWQYDAAGRMTQMVTNDGTADYTNDDTNQLTDADYVGDWQSDEDYDYDSNGNRDTGYTTGDNNQLLSDGTYRYQYDAEGNRTLRYIDVDADEVFDAGDTDATEYTWDHRNRLTEVEDFTTYANYNADTSEQVVDYTYDYANRLIARTLDPDGTSGATAVEQSIYVYEANQIVAQFDKTGTGDLAATDLSHRYLWNPQAIDQLFADEQVHYDGGFVTDELLWTLTDHLGSVRDLATYDSGSDETTVATHRVFDAFGNETSSTGSAECLFGYTGKFFDDATQSQWNWERWYDALVGRWLSQDQIWDGTNLYAYVGNSPMTNTDPTGRIIETIWDIGNVLHDAGRLAKNAGEMVYEGSRWGYHAIRGDEEGKKDAAEGLKQDAGEFVEAAGDAVVDAIATAVPIVPAGGTKIIRGIRGATKGADKLKGARNIGGKTIDAAGDATKKTPSNKAGGGKNAQHANQARREAAKKRYEKLKAEYEAMKRTPNKTKEFKKKMEKVRKARDKAKQDMDFTGEQHSQRGKGCK